MRHVVLWLNFAFLMLAQSTFGAGATLPAGGFESYDVDHASGIAVPPGHFYHERRLAAQTLQKYLKSITGNAFRINDHIEEGDIALLPIDYRDSEFSSLDKSLSGFYVSAREGTLMLSSADAISAHHSVYFLLEKYFNCIFLTPEVEIIPKFRGGSLRIESKFHTPSFQYREILNGMTDDITFSLKRGLNGYFGHRAKATSEGFGKAIVAGITPKKIASHFKEATDYSCGVDLEYGNQRIGDLTYNYITQTLDQRSMQWADYIYLPHGDSEVFCRAYPNDTRIAATDRYLSHGELLQEKISSSHIPSKILLESYRWSSAPSAREISDIGILFSLSELDKNYALTHESNKRIVSNLKMWQEKNIELLVWHYITNFDSHIYPMANVRSVAEDIKFLSGANNVSGMFIQGAASTRISFFQELRVWLYSNLLWDSSLSIDALIDQFLKSYYSDAWPYIKDYLHELEKYILVLDGKNKRDSCAEFENIGKIQFRKIESYLSRALEMDLNEDVKKRISKLYLHLDAIILNLDCGIEFFEASRLRTLKTLENNDEYQKHSEKRNGNEYLYYLEHVSATDQVEVEIDAKEITFQEGEFLRSDASYYSDQLASNNLSMRIPGNSKKWDIRVKLDDLERGVWDLYFIARLIGEPASKDAIKVNVGVRGKPKNKKEFYFSDLTGMVYVSLYLSPLEIKREDTSHIAWLSYYDENQRTELLVDSLVLVRR